MTTGADFPPSGHGGSGTDMMAKKRSKGAQNGPTAPKFTAGADVEAAYGMLLPELPGVSFEGWTGAVEKVDRRYKPPRYLVRWSEETLANLPKTTRKRLKAIGLPFEAIWLHGDDLERRGAGEPPLSRVNREPYDASWDTGDWTGLDRKWPDWEGRDWEAWLKANLSFPFRARRSEDDDDAYFTDVAWREPFRLGARMLVLGLAGVDAWRDVLLGEARQGRFHGEVPLSDLEVVPKDDPNYWPVREYVVWHANSR
jgi:hypothetical protein